MDARVTSRPITSSQQTSTLRGRDGEFEVREMTPGIRLVKSLLLGVCFQALVGCVFGPTAAAAVPQVPPVQAWTARVWFLRQFSPGESLERGPVCALGF